MTAMINELHHQRDEFLFHCPLTGSPVVGDVEQSFERCTSPYFLFCITEAGIVYARRDELPEPFGSSLQDAVRTLFDAGAGFEDAISAFELDSFMPNVVAGLLPETTMIFDIRGPGQRDQGSARTWVVMDFCLPEKVLDPEMIDHVADLVPIE